MSRKRMYPAVWILVLSLFFAREAGAQPAASVDQATLDGVEYAARANHDDPSDYIWDSPDVTRIILNGDTITVEGEGATVAASTVTIGSAGTYSISGALTDGQVIVDTGDEEPVRLILSGANINNSTGSPLYVMDAAEVIIILDAGTENAVADGAAYVFPGTDEDEPNAALFSKSDLTISGDGALTVTGNYNDGIASKDGLVISGGTITVTAVDDGIRGKDYVVVRGGRITVSAQGDGLKSDSAEDAAEGYISIENGVINVVSGGDAIQAETGVTITGGEIALSSGGGSNNWIGEAASAKGIKAVVSVTIDGGSLTIDSADDALHSNGSLVINGGTFALSSGDDAVHADVSVEINDGDMRVTASYEGIESARITLNGGTLNIVSSDDGLNVAGGVDGSGMLPGMGRRGARPGGQAGQAGQPAQETFAASGDYYLHINGGYLVLDAGGDGFDIGGSIAMTDGVVIVHGPVENMNGALDCDGSFSISGGLLVAAGSAGMAQAPDESSTQPSLLLNFSSTLRAGTLVHIVASDGREVLTFAPAKDYQSIAFSSAELVTGASYVVYYGGSASGAAADGLYQDGVYTGGTEYTSFTASSMVTMIGSRGRW